MKNHPVLVFRSCESKNTINNHNTSTDKILKLTLNYLSEKPS